LTHLARQSIDVATAQEQHHQYEDRLKELGLEVLRLPADPDLPDSVFVEDTAVVVDKLAVIARPGAESRRAETLSVGEALKPYRELLHIEPPGTLDGGDALFMGKTLFAGLSERSNPAGIEQLGDALRHHGYRIRAVELKGCLHLKSAVTEVAEGTLLINRRWVDGSVFGRADLIDVDPSEPFGANALRVAETVIYPRAYPRTRMILEDRGISVTPVNMSELAKAEGGVTCCSLILRT
jgi:dimethylargininase